MIKMNPINEMQDKALSEIMQLESSHKDQVQKEFSEIEENIKRKIDNARSWAEALKSVTMDMSKFVEVEKNDAAKAKERLAAIEKRFSIAPAEIALQTQRRVLFDERLSSPLAGAHSPAWYYFYHPYYGDKAVYTHNEGGVTQGSCSVNLSTNEMNPRSYAVGDGSGIADDNSVITKGWFWFYIPGSYIKTPGLIYVWPYFDIHGYYWVRANDGFWTSKEARVRLKMCTTLYQYYYSSPFCWTVLDRGDDNIDETSRRDLTGYNYYARAALQVGAGDPVYVLVETELYSYTSGSGSYALLDFQTGAGNYIKIPNLAVWVP
jgi:hypothetical protein